MNFLDWALPEVPQQPPCGAPVDHLSFCSCRYIKISTLFTRAVRSFVEWVAWFWCVYLCFLCDVLSPMCAVSFWDTGSLFVLNALVGVCWAPCRIMFLDRSVCLFVHRQGYLYLSDVLASTIIICLLHSKRLVCLLPRAACWGVCVFNRQSIFHAVCIVVVLVARPSLMPPSE